MSAPRFPAVALDRGHYESYYLRAADPASGRSAWIRHTVFKRPGGPVDRRAVVHAVRRRRARAARGQAVAAGPARRRLARARAEPHRARRRPRARRGAGPQRGLGAHLRPGLRTAAPPSPPQALRRPAAANQDGEPAARHDDLRLGRGGRRALGARRLARHARPQLGRRARRALDLAARRGLRRRARRMARRRARPHPHRPLHHAVDRQRRSPPRRGAASASGVWAGGRAWTSGPTAASSRSAACASRCARRRWCRGSTRTRPVVSTAVRTARLLPSNCPVQAGCCARPMAARGSSGRARRLRASRLSRSRIRDELQLRIEGKVRVARRLARPGVLP